MKILLTLIVATVLAGCATVPSAQPIAVKRSYVLTGEYAHVAASDTPPRPIFRKAPQYPAAFRKSGIRGEAVVYFVVDSNGMPVQVQYLEATDIAFAESAIETVSQWRFEPATKNGVAVPACVKMPLVFDIQ
jgi:protein TonB